MEDYIDDQGEENEILEMAYEQSIKEVDEVVSFLRLYHWLSTFNQKNELVPSSTGGITLSESILKTMGYGFIKSTHARPQTFLIHLQDHEYELLSGLTIQAAWLEDEGVCVLFRAVKYSDFLIPPIRLSFPVISPVVYQKIKDQCEFITITNISGSEINPGKFVVREVKNPVAPLLKEAPSPTKNTQSYMRVFE